MKTTFRYLDPDDEGWKEMVIEHEYLLSIDIEDDDSGTAISVSKNKDGSCFRVACGRNRSGIHVQPVANNAINISTPGN